MNINTISNTEGHGRIQPHFYEKSQGVILFKIALLLMPIVGLLSLAMDIGLLLANRTTLQSAADSAILAAVDQLLSLDTSEFDGSHEDVRFRNPDEYSLPDYEVPRWRRNKMAEMFSNTKLALLAALKAYSPSWRGLSNAGRLALQNETVLFDFNGPGCIDNNNNSPDYPGFESSCAIAGNVQILLTRGIRCYDGTQRLFCSVENDSRNWFKANAAFLEMRINNLPRFFSAIFGVTSHATSVRSMSYLPETQPPVCGLPTCLTLVSNFLPGNCMVIQADM